jgi:hypothetical protein
MEMIFEEWFSRTFDDLSRANPHLVVDVFSIHCLSSM